MAIVVAKLSLEVAIVSLSPPMQSSRENVNVKKWVVLHKLFGKQYYEVATGNNLEVIVCI